MDFSEQLQSLAKKIAQQSSMITTEEATKNAFVMPFLNRVLGYDVFDPTEVIPEFTADTGIKKGEKVDYAILKDGQVQILVECNNTVKNSRPSTLVNSFAIFQLPMLESAFLPMGHNMSSTQTLMPQTKWTKNHF